MSQDSPIPNGTFRFEIRKDPTHEWTEADSALACWAFREFAMILGWGSEEQIFQLPYGQGGGMIYITQHAPEGYSPRPEDMRKYSDISPEAVLTGWFLVDEYTDSFTGVFVSPIYMELNGQYKVEAD